MSHSYIKKSRAVNCNEKFNVFVTITVSYRILLDLGFFCYISPLWSGLSYGRYEAVEFNFTVYFLSWLLLIITLRWGYYWFANKDFSSLTLLLLYNISYIPFTSMTGFRVFRFGFVVSNFMYWLVLSVFANYLRKIKKPTISLKRLNGNKIFFSIILLASTVMMLLLGVKTNFRVNLNIDDVYNLRSIWRSISMPSYMSYLLGFTRFAIPVGLYLFLKEKKYIMFMLVVINTLINYSFDGGKALLLLSVASIGFAFIGSNRFFDLLPVAFPLLLLFGFLDYLFLNGYLFLLIIRRLLYVPSLIDSYVYDFMLTNKPNYFSQLLRFVGVEQNYLDINYQIGSLYFNSPTMSANSGTISDALWQFGYVGILFLPFIIVVFLFFADTATKNIEPLVLTIPALVTAYYLNNSSITAALFSHGAFTFILFMFLYKRTGERTGECIAEKSQGGEQY